MKNIDNIGYRIIKTFLSRALAALNPWIKAQHTNSVRVSATDYYTDIQAVEIGDQTMVGVVMDIPTFPSEEHNCEEVNRVIVGYIPEISNDNKQAVFQALHELGRKEGKHPHNIVNRTTVVVLADHRKGFVRANPRIGHYIYVRASKKGIRDWKTIIGQVFSMIAKWLKLRAEKIREAVAKRGIVIYGVLRDMVEWVEEFVQNLLATDEAEAYQREVRAREWRRARGRERYKSMRRIEKEAIGVIEALSKAKIIKS